MALLKEDPSGLTVTEVSRRLGLNRNSTARYLDILQISGLIDLRSVGRAKLFYPSFSVPIRAMLNFSSDLIIVVDTKGSVIEVNSNLLSFLGAKREMVIETNIFESPLHVFNDIDLKGLLKRSKKVGEVVFESIVDVRGKKEHLRGKVIPTTLWDGTKGSTILLENVTDQRTSELKLRESESKYRAIFDNSLDALLIVDGNIVVDANDAALELYGLSSKQELIGTHPWHFSPPFQPDGSPSKESITMGMENVLKGRDFKFEWVQRKKDGRRILTLMTVRPITIDGKPMIQALMHDITERKDIEENLKATEERSRGVMSSLHESFISLLDRDLSIEELWASSDIEHVFSKVPGGMKGGSVLELISVDERAKVKEAMETVFITRNPIFIECNLDLPGHPTWHEISLNVFQESGTGSNKLVLFSRDVTKQHVMREDLKEVKRRCDVLDANLRDIIWMVDRSLRFSYLSSSVRQVLGYEPEELLGSRIDRVLTQRSFDELRAALEKLDGSNEGDHACCEGPVLLELESVRKDGRYIWTELSLTVLKGGDNHHLMVGATRDISKRKKAEEQLKRFSLAFHFSKEALIITGMNGEIIEINRSAIVLLGGSDRNQFIGKDGLGLLAPDEREKATRSMAETEKGGESGLDLTITDLRGIEHALSVNASVIRGDLGEAIGFVVALKEGGKDELDTLEGRSVK